jgi:hypothetical protein
MEHNVNKCMSSTRFQFPFPDLNQIPTRNPHSVTKTKQPQIIDNQETNPKVRIFNHLKIPTKLTSQTQTQPFPSQT